MLAVAAVRSARPAVCFRELGTRPSSSGTSIGRRILDSIRQARESLQAGGTVDGKGRSLTQALADLEAVVVNSELPPTMLDSNRQMLRRVQGFCIRLGFPNSFPPKETLRVQFAIKKPTGINYARGMLRTTGFDCEESVKSDLTALFQRAGVNPSFSFLENEFVGGRHAFLRAMDRKSRGLPPRPAPKSPRGAAQSAALPPPPLLSDEQINSLNEEVEASQAATAEKEGAAARWKSRMQQMDPLFGALAALPWVVDVDPEKARHVQTTVLDSLEGDGWDVRGAVHKIWAGTRDYNKLRVGVDPGSCDAIKAVLAHTQRYDAQYGAKTYTPQ